MLMDETDQALLTVLRDNGRASVAELGRQLGLSRTTVKDRISRLENRGIIRGYSVVIDEIVTRGHVSAHVMVTLSSSASARVIRKLKQMPQIRKAFAVSGIYDLIVVVEASSTGELDEILDTIRELEGIKDTLTSVVLSTKFEK